MDLIAYIKGKRHGKGAHRLERESMQDPFLADAIDGFDAVEGPHTERIDTIRRRLSHRSHHTMRRFTYSGIAASLLICLVLGGYYLFNHQTDDFLATSEAPIKEEMEVAAAIVEDQHELTPLEDQEEKAADAELSAVPVEESQSAVSAQKSQSAVPVEVNPSAVPPVARPVEQPAAPVKPVIEEGSERVDVIVQDEQLVAQVSDRETDQEAEDEMQSLEAATEKLAVKKDAKELNALKSREQSSGTALSRSVTGQHKKNTARLETPEPEIGWRAYKKYLKEALRRPSEGACAGAKGTVEVTFHIDKNGKPYDYVIAKTVCPEADAEAIRLIREGGLWTFKSDKRMTVEVKF